MTCRSNYKPSSLADVIKHDKNVQKNWLAISEGETEGGPIALRYLVCFGINFEIS